MKTTTTVIGLVFVVTVASYVLAYYVLPVPPTIGLMVLLAGMAFALVLAIRFVWRKTRRRKNVHTVLLLLSLVLSRHQTGSAIPASAETEISRLCQIASGPMKGIIVPYPTELPVGSPCHAGIENSGVVIALKTVGTDHISHFLENDPIHPPGLDDHAQASSTPIAKLMRRANGIAFLPRGDREEERFGLYTYALFSHAPADREIERYRSFLRALLSLGDASDVAISLPHDRINIMYLPTSTEYPAGWEVLPTDARAEYVLYHYDYATSAAMLATLPNPTGDGPILLSVLEPLDLTRHPDPVLVQDLSKAQPDLIQAYVTAIVNETSKPNPFGQSDSLELRAVQLENLLEIASGGIDISRNAVSIWLHFAQWIPSRP
jgi:hypothetical protein